MFGGTPNMFMFWLFPENGSISERTVNRALIVHTTLQNSALTRKKYKFSFSPCTGQHYPLALTGYGVYSFESWKGADVLVSDF